MNDKAWVWPGLDYKGPTTKTKVKRFNKLTNSLYKKQKGLCIWCGELASTPLFSENEINLLLETFSHIKCINNEKDLKASLEHIKPKGKGGKRSVYISIMRHGFAIALLVGEKPAPIHVVSKLLGHSDIETTLIYLDAVGNEQRKLVMQALYYE